MRRTICTLLYRLGLHRLACWVSPSIYWHLHGKEVGDAFAAEVESVIGAMTKKKEG